MTWNHRVIRRTDMKTGNVSYEIFEVFYDEKDRIDGWTADAVGPYGETMAELRQDLQHFAEALNLPLLEETVVMGKPTLLEVRSAIE